MIYKAPDNLSGQIQFVRVIFLAHFCLKTMGNDAEIYELQGRNLWATGKKSMSCRKENYDLDSLT